MTRKHSPARYSLPDVIDPENIRCYKLLVPDERHHIAAFLGQIKALARAYTWHNDDAHTAKDVAAVWDKIFEGLVFGNCNIGGDEMQFRQNGCVLEFSVDCVHWMTLYDPTDCIHEIAGQPGPTGTTPTGECQEFDVTLNASEEWLLPTTVSDGYTIEITNLKGAWNDGGGLNWYCPDGTPYILGQCVGLKGHAGGDPSGSLYHMAVIGKIYTGTPVYFDATTGTYTVPGSTGQQSVSFRANDSDLTNNFGQVTFHVKVCNTTLVEWTHVFDFIASNESWVGRPTYSAYVGGDGWEDASGALYVQSPAQGADYDLTYAKMEFSVVTPDTQTGGVVIDTRDASWNQLTELLRNNSLFQTGGVLEWTGSETVPAGDGLAFSWSGNGSTSAHVRLTKCTLGGTGTDPF